MMYMITKRGCLGSTVTQEALSFGPFAGQERGCWSPPNHRAGSRMYSVEVKTVKRHTDTLGDQGLTMATL